ncbi:SAVED domain-containing protein [Escherichia coli]|nr:SAVED domain-containing protein [Escherichia coli]
MVLHGDDDFTLWFGEAKFYNSIEDARLSSIINSVGDALRTDKLRKENSIITNINDIDLLISNVDLRRRIKEALSPKNSIDLLKPKIHVPIFILHECQLTKVATSMSSDYIDDIVEYHKNRAIAFFKNKLNY